MSSSAYSYENVQLFSSKINPPQPLSQPLFRERLFLELNAAWKRKLTIITAPAGYGKTSLLQCWTGSLQQPVKWLRLDPDDNELRRFLFYFLQTLPFSSDAEQEQQADRIQHLNAEDGPPQLESIAARWIAVLDRLEDQHMIVIDGLEAIRNPDIYRFLTIFLRYSPSNLHMILSSRQFSNLGVSLSGGDGTTYLGTEDLALTDRELRTYISQRISTRLTEPEIDELMQRSEGWFVGVNAYLPFIRNEENVYGEPDRHSRAAHNTAALFRNLIHNENHPLLLPILMQLSVTKQLDEALATLLTDNLDQKMTLTELSQGGWFLLPSRNQSGQFVFHPMFADFLQRVLREASEETYAALKLKCVVHLEQKGHYVESIRHALEGEFREQAAAILLEHAAELMRDNHLTPLFEQFTDSEMVEHPELAVMYADRLIHARKINAAERIINLLNDTMAHHPNRVFSPTGEKLSGYVAAIHSMIHFSRRETDLGLSYMQKVAAELGGPGMLHRHSLYFHPYTASLLSGKYGHYGVLKSALVTCEFCLPRWGQQDTAYAIMLVCMGECCFEEGLLDQSETYLRAGLQLGLDLDNPGLFIPTYVAWAQLKFGKGEKEAAWVALREARSQLIRRNLGAGLAVVDACEVKLKIREQNIQHVRQWMRTAPIRSISVSAIPQDRMFEAFIMLRVYIFEGRTSEALTLGESLLHMALLTNHPKDLIEAHLMLAQIYRKQGKVHQALEKMNYALSEAHIHGYVQVIDDEGATLTELLTECRKRYRQQGDSQLEEFTSKLLKRIQKAKKSSTASAPLTAALTRQEQRVFQLLLEGSSNRTIANRLAISPETVKRHCRHVYRKLGVENRVQAIEQFSRQVRH